MNQFGNYSADFKRHIGRPLLKGERAVIGLLERQRQRTGRVRAYIDDVSGRYQRVLVEYLRWHQQRLSKRDAVIITPRKMQNSESVRGRMISARQYECVIGSRLCIGQILLLGADKYCPSVAKRTSYLDRILARISPYLSGKDSIMIVCGNGSVTDSRFAQLLEQWRQRNEFYQIIDDTTIISATSAQPITRKRIIYVVNSTLLEYRFDEIEAPILPNMGLRAKVA